MIGTHSAILTICANTTGAGIPPKTKALGFLPEDWMKHFLKLFCIVMLFFSFGCSSDEEPSDEEPSDVEPSVVAEMPPEPVEIEETTEIVPLPDAAFLASLYAPEVESLEDKTRVEIVTVLEGTQRVAIPARFRGIRDFGFGFPLYECELMSEEVEALGGIAAGMSGSPVGPPGKIMGALAYGDNFSSAPTRFWVTSIDAMERARDHQTFGDELAEHLAGAPSAVRSVYAPVKTPLMISGIRPHRLKELSSYLTGSGNDYLELFAAAGRAPAAPATDRDLMAGDMIGVAIATGDVVNAIGYGTVTEVYDDNTFVAFGHPFSAYGNGKNALPVYRAVVNGLVPNLQSTYKSTSAYGDPIGTVTKDLIPAIVGELGEAPETISLTIKYQRGKDVIEKSHEIAYGYERYIAAIAATTQDAIRLETSPTTVEVTLELHFKETEKTYTETFMAASEDTFIDVFSKTERIVSAFTDTFANTAGAATLTSVEMTIREEPQIRVARIHEVIAPDEIVRGTTATFTVVLIPHWNTVEDGDRKIEEQVTLAIPSDYPLGFAWISVFSENPEDDLFDDLFSEVDFGTPAEDLDELIETLEDDQPAAQGEMTIVLSEDIVFPDDFIFDEPQNEITLDAYIVTGSESEFVEIE